MGGEFGGVFSARSLRIETIRPAVTASTSAPNST